MSMTTGLTYPLALKHWKSHSNEPWRNPDDRVVALRCGSELRKMQHFAIVWTTNLLSLSGLELALVEIDEIRFVCCLFRRHDVNNHHTHKVWCGGDSAVITQKYDQ